MGRPEVKIDLKQVKKLSAQGLTHEQICHCLGVTPSVFYRQKRKYREFQEACDVGKAQGVQQVVNAMFESALAGNIQAQRTFLFNRDKDNWKDKHEVEHSGSMEHTITVVDPGCGYVGPDKATDD
jgi:hypothetical protein